MTTPKKFAALLALLLAGAGWGVPFASAGEEASADCCSDLEERIAELEASAVLKGARKVSLTVSGIITIPVIAWDDGKKQDTFIVSNEVKRSRWRFDGKAAIDPRWSAGYVLEIGPNPSPFAPMDQFAFDSSADGYEVRYSHWWLNSRDLGRISMGLQSQATDTITEVSLANTSPVVSPGLPIFLGYLERGWFMRKGDGTLTSLRFGELLFRGRNDIWGEGHRWDVVRYDSPALAGFTLSASWGMDDTADMALRYAGEFGRFKFAAGLGATAWRESTRSCAKASEAPDVDCWEVGGSLSIMDKETGLFLNTAAGYGKDNNTGRAYGNAAGIDDDETFTYLVAGIERQWLAIGTTTLFGHYWHRDIAAAVNFFGVPVDATPLGAGAFVSGAGVSVYGAGVVQTIGEGVDLYASLNRAETSVATSADGAVAGSTRTAIAPFDFLIAGASVRF